MKYAENTTPNLFGFNTGKNPAMQYSFFLSKRDKIKNRVPMEPGFLIHLNHSENVEMQIEVISKIEIWFKFKEASEK